MISFSLRIHGNSSVAIFLPSILAFPNWCLSDIAELQLQLASVNKTHRDDGSCSLQQPPLGWEACSIWLIIQISALFSLPWTEQLLG